MNSVKNTYVLLYSFIPYKTMHDRLTCSGQGKGAHNSIKRPVNRTTRTSQLKVSVISCCTLKSRHRWIIYSQIAQLPR